MFACEFCEEVSPGPGHHLRPEDVAWMADYLLPRHRTYTRAHIVLRLKALVYCSEECALASGAHASLAESLYA